MEYRIGLIHGDGIGPEIVDEAKRFWTLSARNMDISLNIPIFCWAELPSMCMVCR